MRQIWSFSKVSSKTDFNEYKKLFQFIIPDCDLKKLKEEFEHYLLEELPETDNFDIIKCWCSLSLSYPLLSKIALTRVCVACGSLDAERLFSKFRNILVLLPNLSHIRFQCECYQWITERVLITYILSYCEETCVSRDMAHKSSI